MGKRCVDRVDIVGKMAYNVSRCVGIKVAYGECGQLFEYLLSHSVGNSLTQVYHYYRKKVGKKSGDHVAADHIGYVTKDLVELHSSLEINGINSRTRKSRSHKRELICAECEKQSDNKQRPLTKHVFTEP